MASGLVIFDNLLLICFSFNKIGCKCLQNEKRGLIWQEASRNIWQELRAKPSRLYNSISKVVRMLLQISNNTVSCLT